MIAPPAYACPTGCSHRGPYVWFTAFTALALNTLYTSKGEVSGGSKLLRSLPQNQHVSIFLGLRSRAKDTGHDEDE